MKDYGRGIFMPSNPGDVSFPHRDTSSLVIELPPKEIANTLLRLYHDSLHLNLPIIHWPSFMEQYEKVYSAGSLQEASPAWRGLFFAVLACGTLSWVE